MKFSENIYSYRKENPALILYILISALFFFGTIEYDLVNLYSDQFMIMIMQIFICSFIINSLIAISIDLTKKKRDLVIANCHILLILYFNLVFQMAQKLNFGFPKTEFVASLFLAMAFVILLVFVTNETYFNEKIWSISLYFSLVYLLDIAHNKYFTALFAVIFLVNLAYKFQIYVNGILNRFYFQHVEIDSRFKEIFNFYGAISIIYWCCIYHIINSRVGRNNVIIVISFGFLIPNIMLILQYIYPNVPLLYITIIGYYFFNIVLQKAQIHAKNVISDPEMLLILDEVFVSLPKKDLVFFGLLKNSAGKAWTGFKYVAKESFNAGGGPKNWGPQVGAVAGFFATTYFGFRYIKQNDEANEIAKDQNEIAKKQNALLEKQNNILEKQTIELKKNNDLLVESNGYSKKGADAAVEYNNIARQQEPTTYDPE